MEGKRGGWGGKGKGMKERRKRRERRKKSGGNRVEKKRDIIELRCEAIETRSCWQFI